MEQPTVWNHKITEIEPINADSLPGKAGPSRRSSPQGRPSRQRAADITRRIIENATRLFLTKGYDGTSMEAVAAVTVIPKPTLYKRFPDKQALLRAVLESRIAKWRVVTSRRQANLGDNLGDRLTSRVITLMTWAMKPEVRAVTRLAYDGLRSAGMRGARENFFAHNDMVAVIVSDIIRYGPAQGMSTQDPERIAQVLMTLVSGWIDHQDDKDRVPAAAVRRDARFFVDLIILGREAW